MIENNRPSLPHRSIGLIESQVETKLLMEMSMVEKELLKLTFHKDEEDGKEGMAKLLRVIGNRGREMLQMAKSGDIESLSKRLEENSKDLINFLDLIEYDLYQREIRLGSYLEQHCLALILLYFYQNGMLIPFSLCQPCGDEEYIGAVILFAQELSRYALNQACNGDAKSVEICRRLTIEINQSMLTFDFRNGSLRRKYDSLKYSLKLIEDITFELSLDSDIEGSFLFNDEEFIKVTSQNPNVNQAIKWEYVCHKEIEEIRIRMESFDSLREQVIKDSRDMQKLAKQGIYSIIRGNYFDGRVKLTQVSKLAEQIFPKILHYSNLRPGSFSNALEEWCEGMLLLEWCENKTIMGISDLKIVNAMEYIGGLSDFTGELGRLAIAYAAKRDIESVRLILEVDRLIYYQLSRLNTMNKFNKKVESVQTNLRKIEEVLFELTMLQRSGRRKRMRSSDQITEKESNSLIETNDNT